MLDLQDLDLQLDQVAHKRKTLPEHRALAELAAEKAVVDRDLVTADTEVSDLQREQKKADTDAEQVRQRKARNQQRLDSGQVTSPKDLENLQHEVVSLDRRISDLEDAELEVMEKLEAAEAVQADLRTRAEAFAGRQAELESTRDAALKELDEQRAEFGDKRATVAAELPGRPGHAVPAAARAQRRYRCRAAGRQALHGLPDGARAVRSEPDQGGRRRTPYCAVRSADGSSCVRRRARYDRSFTRHSRGRWWLSRQPGAGGVRRSGPRSRDR